MEDTFTWKELELKHLLADLELRKTMFNEMHADVNIIRDAASNFQTFMSIPQYIKHAHCEEVALQSLCENESFNWNSILVNLTSIQALKDNLTSFGTMRTKRKASSLGLKVQKSRQAQLTATGFFSKTIETIQFKEVYQNQIQNRPDILDCGILPNGELLFSDRSKKCLIKCDTRRVFVHIDLPFFPVKFTIVDENNIAVTSEKELHIVKLDDHNILKMKTFHLKKEVGSVIIYDNNYIIEDLAGYQIIDSEGYFIKHIPIRFYDSAYRAPVCFNNKIYFVDYKSSKIFCYDFDGNKISEFQNEKLIWPHGITSNNSNILFACGYRSNNVCALSVDGKILKEIIGPKTELKCATAVHYSVKRKELLVVTSYGNFFVFSEK